MIGFSSVSENHSSANESMHVDGKQSVLVHMNEEALYHVNGTLLPISWFMGDHDQLCSSINGSSTTHLNTNHGAFIYEGARQMSSDYDIKHPSPDLQIHRKVLANESIPGPSRMQTDGSASAAKVSIIDICNLKAERQNGPSYEGNDLVVASESGTPMLVQSGWTSPSSFECQKGDFVKKVSFGAKSLPPGMDCTHPQKKPQPPKNLYSLSLTRPGDDHNGSEDSSKQQFYKIFRTRSEGALSRRQSRQVQEQQDEKIGHAHGKRIHSIGEGSVSAGRYFDALRGPELDELKDSEKVLLPLDEKWPFLLRFPVVAFGICLGLATQAVLWKLLATSASTAFLHVPNAVNFALWCLALFALIVTFIIYALKCLFYFEAVLREFQHPVRVNFFFAPWIGWMLIALSVPPSMSTSIHPAIWCVLVTPLLILELKIYGQWLSGGKRKLSKVANASTHLSLVGNFISAILAAKAGWTEPAIFCWAVGSVHYLVLFVTLYQRLPTAEALPKELHPVFFLFIAVPSTASVSWKYIVGHFDNLAKVAYFIALFLLSSLVVRVKFFCGFRFSVAWWAYTFPMTALACATIHYSIDVRHPITQVLAVTFSAVATLTMLIVFICTVVQLMRRSLFPNDIAIAITNNRQREGCRKHQEKNISDASSSDKTSDGSGSH